MIRRKTGLKEIAIGSLLGVALVSVACSDGDEQPLLGSAGTAGSNAAGMSNGGSNAAGTSSTAGNGGTSTAGTSNGGTSTAGTGGSEGGMPNSAGAGDQAAGEGGAAAGAGGEWAAGGQGGAGQGGEGGEAFVADTLDNPGFEVGTSHVNIPGWTNEGTPDAAYIEYASAHSGSGKLSHWMPWTAGGANLPFTARTFQTVGPIANGKYSVSLWLRRDWFDEQYLFVKGHNAAAPDEQLKKCLDACAPALAQGTYVQVTLSGIDVTSGSITVGVYSAGPAGSSAGFDDFQLTRE